MKKLEKCTLKEMIDRTCETFPERPALAMVDGEPINYGELRQLIDEVIAILVNHGIVPGDKVVILSQNMPNWGIAYLAITSMGAVVVPILCDFHNNEILQIIKHSGAKLVFVSTMHYDKIGYADIEPYPMMINIDTFTDMTPRLGKETLGEIIRDGGLTLAKLRNKALKAVGLIKSEVGEDDLAAIIYTSGTTGSSKGVMLSHRNLVMDAILTLGIQHVDEKDRLISILPLSHTYECTLGFIIPMMQGSSVYYLDKPPTARILIPAMQKIKPTMILTVPLIIEKIFKMQVHPQLTGNIVFKELYKLPVTRKLLHKVAGKKLMKTFGGQIHFFGIGGALLSHDVERFLYEAGFPYAIGYGLTETSPLIAGCTPAVVKFRSTGTILDTLKVRIANPDPKTGIGEIQIKGQTVMKGYYKDKERTEEAYTEDGYFKTGDLGIIKRHNYLYIKGRIKNVIIAACGENIYPEEIEAKLNEDEMVLESLVYESGGNIIARVFLNYEMLEKHHNINKVGSAQAERIVEKILMDLKNHVNQNVASFSRIHKIVEQREPFEKTPTQKIKRFLYQ
ncbi:MAG TPA: AMP-binding protein [Candidatus Cloacimonadota bacterium]|nr:AMP-binding protein [Candidatus Cloacimonadota bacterium]HPS38764.1 AMP-binding protein [Candidatus Cloacimonadota bacterium]